MHTTLHARRLAADYDSNGLITPAAYLRHAKEWRLLGASIIGGCCGVGPDHIRAVAEQAL
jgi:S-methylmethionine-dependent homocysteine/selenocysteine methylase